VTDDETRPPTLCEALSFRQSAAFHQIKAKSATLSVRGAPGTRGGGNRGTVSSRLPSKVASRRESRRGATLERARLRITFSWFSKHCLEFQDHPTRFSAVLARTLRPVPCSLLEILFFLGTCLNL
jgi:hypothetical protein